MIFAVVGTREPDEQRVAHIEEFLRDKSPESDVLVIGAAKGVDQEAANRWLRAGGTVSLCLPWDGYEFGFVERACQSESTVIQTWAFKDYRLARKLHPTWPSLSQAARKLHARNVTIARACETMLALPGDKPWGGGTATAIKAALFFGRRLVMPVRQELLDRFVQDVTRAKREA